MGRPGLIGMAARTAVVAGTATAVSGNVQRRQQARAQDQYEQQQSEAQQQQAAAAAEQAAPAAAPADDMMTKLQQLATLHTQGVLSDDEFAAAKAKLLA
ncbi:SHOCT domain-containing protein [Leifsonia sp. McL0607]|uniref:SHOCT domain-containing protein n=1 Tax=Leifsonia sp. McL0607 TaxID=3415672 RepID=UPI003CF4B567